MSWKLELLTKPGTEQLITEGPVWNGEHILFTQIRENRILRYDPKTDVIDGWRTGTNRTNGLAYDENGRLFGCCSGGRAIVRFDPDGKNVVIADKLDGKRLNTPNDLAIDRKGRIWFTNPVNEGNWDKTEVSDLDHRSVLRADPQPDGRYTVTRVTFDTTQPTASSSRATSGRSTSRKAVPRRAFRGNYAPIRFAKTGASAPATRSSPGARTCAPHRGIDGSASMRKTTSSRRPDTTRAARARCCMSSHTRPRARTHPVPANRPTNCCSGGADLTTIFVTCTNGHFFKARTERVGWAMYP